MPRFAMQLREALSRKLMEQAGADGAAGGGGAGDAGGQDANTDNNGDAGGSDEGSQDDNGGAGDAGGSDAGTGLSAEQLLDYRSQYADEEGNIDIDRIISDLHQGQTKSDAPEAYTHEFLKENKALKDYDIPVDDDPLIKSAMTWAKEHGVSQENYQALVTGAMMELRAVQEKQQADYAAQVQEEWSRIDDAQARKDKLSGQLSGMFGEDLKTDVGNLLEHPKGFLILEQMAAKMRDPQLGQGDHQPIAAVSREGLQQLRVERDKALKSGDKAKARELDKKISAGYKKLDEAGKL